MVAVSVGFGRENNGVCPNWCSFLVGSGEAEQEVVRGPPSGYLRGASCILVVALSEGVAVGPPCAGVKGASSVLKRFININGLGNR